MLRIDWLVEAAAEQTVVKVVEAETAAALEAQRAAAAAAAAEKATAPEPENISPSHKVTSRDCKSRYELCATSDATRSRRPPSSWRR